MAVYQDIKLYKDKEKVLTLFNKRKSAAEKYRASYENKWLDLLQLYHGETDSVNYKYRSKLTIPMIYEKVETIVPRWMSGIVAGKSFFGLTGRTAGDRVKAEMHQKVLEYQMEKEVKYLNYFSAFLRSVCLYGSMLRVIDWKTHFSSITGKTLYDGLGNRTLGIYDWWPDPNGFTLDEMQYVIVKDVLSLTDIERLAEKGIFDKDKFLKLKENFRGKASEPADGLESKVKNILGEKTDGIGGSNEDEGGQEIKIFEMWEDDWVVTIAGDVVLRSRENPYDHGKKPFALYRAMAIDGEPYGKSPVEMLRFFNHELNDTRNAKMDARNLAINGMYIGKRGVGLIPEQFRTRPNGIIWAENVDDLKPLAFSNILATTAFEEDQIQSGADRTVGVYDPQRGSGPGELNRTATGITLVIKEGNYRFVENIRQLQVEGVSREVELSYKLNNQFLSKEKLQSITESAGLPELELDEIKGDFNIIVTSSPHLGAKEIERQEIMGLYPLLTENPHIDLRQLTEVLVNSFDGIKGMEKVIKNQQATLPAVSPAQAPGLPMGLPPTGFAPAPAIKPKEASPIASSGNSLAQAFGARPNKGGWK